MEQGRHHKNDGVAIRLDPLFAFFCLGRWWSPAHPQSRMNTTQVGMPLVKARINRHCRFSGELLHLDLHSTSRWSHW